MPALDAPATHAVNVTLSDTVDLPTPCRALQIGHGGDVQVTMMNGDVVKFTNLPAGWHPIRVRRVWLTNTTASDITSVW